MDRGVNVLELLVLIICLLVLNQSELTLPATRESGLAPEQFCNEFSIDMGRGFYPLCSANITQAALGPGLLMFKCSLDIAEDCWFNAREIITITIRQLRLHRKEKSQSLCVLLLPV